MKIKFVKPKEINQNCKATIHKSGKLGFSLAASEKLNLNTNRYLKIGINEDDDSDKNLYILIDDVQTEDSLRISKAGNYYYANTKALFDDLKENFRELNIIYDIIDFELGDMKLYKFIRREYIRNKKKKHQEFY